MFEMALHSLFLPCFLFLLNPDTSTKVCPFPRDLTDFPTAQRTDKCHHKSYTFLASIKYHTVFGGNNPLPSFHPHSSIVLYSARCTSRNTYFQEFFLFSRFLSFLTSNYCNASSPSSASEKKKKNATCAVGSRCYSKPW